MHPQMTGYVSVRSYEITVDEHFAENEDAVAIHCQTKPHTVYDRTRMSEYGRKIHKIP